MVLLDVVDNHFGPDGNYCPLCAGILHRRAKTPWGQAINFDEPMVREFYIHNALYWLEEYRFDGLRLDAVHASSTASEAHFLVELARASVGRSGATFI